MSGREPRCLSTQVSKAPGPLLGQLGGRGAGGRQPWGPQVAAHPGPRELQGPWANPGGVGSGSREDTERLSHLPLEFWRSLGARPLHRWDLHDRKQAGSRWNPPGWGRHLTCQPRAQGRPCCHVGGRRPGVSPGPASGLMGGFAVGQLVSFPPEIAQALDSGRRGSGSGSHHIRALGLSPASLCL